MPDGSFAAAPSLRAPTPRAFAPTPLDGVALDGVLLDSPALYRRPRIAWPTIALLIGAVAAWTLSIVFGQSGAIAWWVSLPLSAVAAYVAFTPAHDAAHRSVSRHTWVNAWVGRAAAVLLFGPFPALRYAHLMHHKHVNEPDTDPDHWSGRGPAILLPLRWATQDLSYYAFIGRRLRSLARRDVVEIGLWLTLQLAIVAALVLSGFTAQVLLYWIVPSRLAQTALACTFDWLPHRPHNIPAKVDRYRATHLITGRLMNALMLCQNLHLIHHLFPAVPWYRYPAIFAQRRERLVAKGARVFSWL